MDDLSLICKSGESQAFPKDMLRLITWDFRRELMAEMEKESDAILCGSVLENSDAETLKKIAAIGLEPERPPSVVSCSLRARLNVRPFFSGFPPDVKIVSKVHICRETIACGISWR